MKATMRILTPVDFNRKEVNPGSPQIYAFRSTVLVTVEGEEFAAESYRSKTEVDLFGYNRMKLEETRKLADIVMCSLHNKLFKDYIL